MKPSTLFLCAALLLTGAGATAQTAQTAQRTWTLDECVAYAVDHNLSVKRQELSCEQQQQRLEAARTSMLPSVSGGVSQNFSFGRGLQSDNTYINTNVGNTSFSIGAGMPLFTGLQTYHNIEFSKLNLASSLETLRQAQEDVSLQVASLYLNVLYAKEVLATAVEQDSLATEQLQRIQAYRENGKASESDVLQARSAQAQDQLAVVQAEGNLQMALLDLTQLLELDSPEGFDVAMPDATPDDVALSQPDDVYGYAVDNRPAVRAAAYQLEGAAHTVGMAKGAWLPTLSLSAGLGSSYYDAGSVAPQPFREQMKHNFNQYVGLSLSVPIFNRMQTLSSVRQARAAQDSYGIQLEETRKALYKEIQQAWTNAVTARERYAGSCTALDAAKASLDVMAEKYAVGQATATEYNEVKSAWFQAAASLSQAKYEYLFRAKILEFYRTGSL